MYPQAQLASRIFFMEGNIMQDKEWFDWRKEVAGCRDCRDTTKVWLLSLATFADETGYCYPNQTQIAERMGRDTRKNLDRCVTQAKKCGHIVVGKSGRSNNYQLALTKSEANRPHSGPTIDLTADPVTPTLTPNTLQPSLMSLYDVSFGDFLIKNSLTRFLQNTHLKEIK